MDLFDPQPGPAPAPRERLGDRLLLLSAGKARFRVNAFFQRNALSAAFLLTHKRSHVNQRELGVDTSSFNRALKSVLRQDPDIILVGEMRAGAYAGSDGRPRLHSRPP